MSRLEKATQISVVFLCLTAAFVLLDQHFRHATGLSAAPPSPTAAELVGKPIDLPGFQWDRAKTTLVVAIAEHCPYCARSMPFYRNLSKIAAEHRASWQFVAISQDDHATIEALLAREGVNVTKVIQASFKTLGIGATPTLLLVDHDGIVRSALRGLLPAQKEAEVVASLKP